MTLKEEYDVLNDILTAVGSDILGHKLRLRWIELSKQFSTINTWGVNISGGYGGGGIATGGAAGGSIIIHGGVGPTSLNINSSGHVSINSPINPVSVNVGWSPVAGCAGVAGNNIVIQSNGGGGGGGSGMLSSSVTSSTAQVPSTVIMESL